MSFEAVIIPKLTLVEWEMRSRNVSQEVLLDQWQEEGVNGPEKLASHYRQKETVAKLARALEVPLVHRDDFNQEVADRYNIIFSPGGDNHLQYVARFIYGEQIVVSLNSDPQTSKGGILPFKPEDIDYFRDCLDRGHIETQRWARLQASINDEKLPYLALSEILVGEYKLRGMCRTILQYRKLREEQKSSGFVVSTGSGLTGWYKNETWRWKDEIMTGYTAFARTESKARFISLGRDCETGSLDIGDLSSNEELIIHSLSKQAEVSFDPDPSDDRFSFSLPRGSKVRISVALEHPLVVAVKNI